MVVVVSDVVWTQGIVRKELWETLLHIVTSVIILVIYIMFWN